MSFLKAMMARLTGPPQPKRVTPPGSIPDANVTYSGSGREGYVILTSGATELRLYREFGGDNVLVTISVPDQNQWVQKSGLSLDLREEVLDYIARQVVADQTTSGTNRYEIGDKWITIFA